jgi:hypothetical protein
MEKPKAKTNPFRKRYAKFWNLLAEKLSQNSSGDNNKRKRAESSGNIRGYEVLRRISEILTILTASALVSLRDSATEAIFSLTKGLLSLLNDLKSTKIVAERQLNAEQANSRTNTTSGNPKIKAYLQQKDEAMKVNNCFLIYPCSLARFLRCMCIFPLSYSYLK